MSSISIPSLLSTILSATFHGCQTIRSIQSSQNLSVQYKIENDKRSALTIADIEAQRIIVSTLLQCHPNLKIVGEEDDSLKDDLDPKADAPSLIRDLNVTCPEMIFPVEELTVYIDPLDGTREFVEGRYENVQCLIGVTHQQKPICGVIGLPFGSGDGIPIVYGVQNSTTKEMLIQWDGSVLPTPFSPVPSQGIKFATGDSQHKILTTATQTFLNLFPSAEHVIMGACGNKLLKIAKQEIQFAILHNKTCSWDTAASTVVIESQNGTITDLFGSPLVYDVKGEHRNSLGIVASVSGMETMHEEFCRKMRSNHEILNLLK